MKRTSRDSIGVVIASSDQSSQDVSPRGAGWSRPRLSDIDIISTS